MQNNKKVNVHLYFGIPFNGPSRSGKCSIFDKYCYLMNVRDYFCNIGIYDQYGKEKKFASKLNEYSKQLDAIGSYPEFRFALDFSSKDDAEYLILAALLSKGEHYDWLVQFRNDSPRLLKIYSNDSSFCKLIDFIQHMKLHAENVGLF